MLRDFILNNKRDAMALLVGETIVEANEAAVRLFGYDSPDEMVGLSVSALLTPESFQAAAERAAGKPTLEPQLYTAIKKGGEQFRIEAGVIAWTDDPNITIVAVNDVSEWEKDLDALRESEKLYRTLAETIPAGVLMEDAKGRIFYANQQMSALTGYSLDELMGSAWPFVAKNDPLRVAYRKAVRKGASVSDYLAQIVRKDGERRWMSISWRPIRVGGTARSGVVAVFLDVTDRIRNEEALRDSEASLRTFVDSIDHPAMLLEAGGKILMVNETLARRVGKSVDELVGADAPSMAFDEVLKQRCEKFKQVVRTGQPMRFEDEREGISYAHYLCPVLGENGKVSRVAIISLDVTELKKAEQALRESEEKYRSIVENSHDMIMLAAPGGKIVYVSPAIERMLGYSPEEVPELTLDIIHPDDREAVAQAIKDGFAGESRSDFEFRFITKSGDILWASHSWSPIIRDGKVHLVVSVVRDITERRIAEDRLRKAHAELERAYRVQREFINNVTHEIRTPMTAVKGYVEMLLEGLAGPLNEAQESMLRKVLVGSESLLDLVTSLLEMSRLRSGEVALRPKVCKPSSIAEKAVSSVMPQATRRGVKVELLIDGPDRAGLYDEEKIITILNNLLSNAVKFTPQGQVEVRVTPTNSGVEIIVADTGIGIPAKHLHKIFDQFHQVDRPRSSKPSGFGLGLAIVANMVELLGATLVVSSKLGVGTAFTLNIPKLKASEE
ncbi:MAG: PAS domain S-box protein [Armatimonadetes bacterium]|nr:PAS domain S-box protein [Armatimonadota bacterium]